ncbi:MAG TPA: hypothetical protein VIG42_00115 [Solirubrobacteraceae bacterium]
MLPFWVSIGSLSLCQGVVVALPRAWSPGRLARLRGPLWALIPAISVIGFVAVGRIDEEGSAQALTYIALVAVPLLAALALGWLVWPSERGKPAWALLAAPMFALAWVDRSGLVGEGAAVALSALSCAALGALIAGVTPARWLALGIVAMALADAALVISDLLQQPNDALNAAHPAAGLPRLQAEMFGAAAMGYGDLFIAGLFGGLLATTGGRARQLAGAALVAVFAGAFDLLFFAVDELPATVPVACALVVLLSASRRHGLSWTRARPAERTPLARAPTPR